MKLPLITILIPTYNRASWLAEALASVLGQHTNGEFTTEVVVVDNNSTDETVQVVEHVARSSSTPVHYVLAEEPGCGQARNAGLERGHGDWVAFLDDDEIAEPHWLYHLWRAAQDHNAEQVGGAVHLLLSDEELARLSIDVRRSLRERTSATVDGGSRHFGPREYPGTDNMLVSAHLLERLNNFDPTVVSGTANSDYDFSIRARRAGARCWFAPAAKVWHRAPANRQTQEFIDWESYRSGVMLAYFDKRYGGNLALIRWAVSRVGQGVLVSAPKALWGRCTRNQKQQADARIRWKRLQGYLAGFLPFLLPGWFSTESVYREVNFAKGRILGQSTSGADSQLSDAVTAESAAHALEGASG